MKSVRRRRANIARARISVASFFRPRDLTALLSNKIWMPGVGWYLENLPSMLSTCMTTKGGSLLKSAQSGYNEIATKLKEMRLPQLDEVERQSEVVTVEFQGEVGIGKSCGTSA